MTGDARINELAQRATEWVDKASAAELWHVLQHGGIAARVGMPGVMDGLGTLPGPGPFTKDLLERPWAACAEGDEDDLADWFEHDAAAQAAARDEIRAGITELFFDLGEWEWKGPAPGAGDGKCSPS